MTNEKNLVIEEGMDVTEVEEVLNDSELDCVDLEPTVIDDCDDPENLDDAKKLLKKLGIGAACLAVLVAVWKKFGKAAFMKLLASILRKSGYTVTEPGKDMIPESTEGHSADDTESSDEESDECEEVEE